VLVAVAEGDLTQKMAATIEGQRLKASSRASAQRSTRWSTSCAPSPTRSPASAREVGTEGKLGGQAEVPGVAGTWKSLTDNVNFMANNLTDQVPRDRRGDGRVADGDLTRKITARQGRVAARPTRSTRWSISFRSSLRGHPRRARVGTEGSSAAARCPASGGT